MKRLAFCLMVACAGLAPAQPPDKQPPPEAAQGEGVSLTIYNQDFVVVRERRLLELPKGRGSVRFRDVAATIVPETVQFTPLGQPDPARVIEQSYEFDLVSADKLLDKYVDREIAVVTREGDTLKGKLLSFDNSHLTLQTPAGIDLVPRYRNIKSVQFSALPEGLLTRPTLAWVVEGKQGGKQLVKVAYAAEKMGWFVDYRAQINKAGDNVDLGAWVTVANETGMTFKNAQVKLMAGEVSWKPKPQRGGTPDILEQRAELLDGKLGDKQRIQETSFDDYHLYQLSDRTTIADNTLKQLELLNVQGVPASRKYETARDKDRVVVILEFKNSKETIKGLGIPLPKGPIRVFQSGADGIAEYVGEDAIDHTPKDELVRVRLGYAFDLKIARQTLAERATKEKQYFDQQIRLRNHKPEAVTVEVIEPVEGRREAVIAANSHPFVRRDVNTLVFTVTVPANGETVIAYTVRYTR